MYTQNVYTPSFGTQTLTTVLTKDFVKRETLGYSFNVIIILISKDYQFFLKI